MDEQITEQILSHYSSHAMSIIINLESALSGKYVKIEDVHSTLPTNSNASRNTPSRIVFQGDTFNSFINTNDFSVIEEQAFVRAVEIVGLFNNTGFIPELKSERDSLYFYITLPPDYNNTYNNIGHNTRILIKELISINLKQILKESIQNVIELPNIYTLVMRNTVKNAEITANWLSRIKYGDKDLYSIPSNLEYLEKDINKPKFTEDCRQVANSIDNIRNFTVRIKTVKENYAVWKLSTNATDAIWNNYIEGIINNLSYPEQTKEYLIEVCKKSLLLLDKIRNEDLHRNKKNTNILENKDRFTPSDSELMFFNNIALSCLRFLAEQKNVAVENKYNNSKDLQINDTQYVLSEEDEKCPF